VKKVKFTAKEQRLLAYRYICFMEGTLPTIGDICKACATTPFTLLSKTTRDLNAKVKEMFEE